LNNLTGIKELCGPIFQKIGQEVLDVSSQKGFTYDDDSQVIALIHSEVSEALEALREPYMKPSDHIPDFNNLEEEMADIVLRTMAYCARNNLRLADAMMAKIEYNRNRSFQHGGKRF
jgi:NTP pyrophosphatase (non-canonical NTP hydrolase)